MNISFHLFQLQKIDSELDRIQDQLTKIDKELSNNPELINSKKNQAELTEKLRQENKKSSELEYEIETQIKKIEISTSSLYGGKVTLPRELRNLEDEIKSLKKHKDLLEDKLLVIMGEVDSLELEMALNSKLIATLEADLIQKNARLQGAKSDLVKNQERLLSERSAAIPQIPAQIQLEYERLRIAKKGISVAAVTDESCAVCGSQITPSEWQNARGGTSIAHCSSCGRILYAG